MYDEKKWKVKFSSPMTSRSIALNALRLNNDERIRPYLLFVLRQDLEFYSAVDVA